MVPPVLAGWFWSRHDIGVVFYPRDGSSSTMRIRARQAPVRPAPVVIATLVEELRIAAPIVGTYEPFVTVEGEYGSAVRIAATNAAGAPVELAVAVLFGDDWITTIEGIASPENIASVAATVRELARTYSLGLGELRRRRYRYSAPAGWSARSRGLIDEWRPVDANTCITVFPARPLSETVAGAVDRALHELVIDGFVATSDRESPLATARFRTGIARAVVGARGGETVHHDVAVLRDDRFFYVCRLESRPDAHIANRAVFAKLVESIEPLPRPQYEANAVDPALAASWVD
jgi:hypothetical protein